MLATVHMERNVIVRSNREYGYFGNEYEYDYFALYSSTNTEKVLVFEYEYDYFALYSSMSTITQKVLVI